MLGECMTVFFFPAPDQKKTNCDCGFLPSQHCQKNIHSCVNNSGKCIQTPPSFPFVPLSPGCWLQRSGRADAGVGLPSACAPTSCSLYRPGARAFKVGQRRWVIRRLGVLFMSRPCWEGILSASKSPTGFNQCSVHCPDRWPLITGEGPGCWISTGALC